MAAFNGVFPMMPMSSFPTMIGQNANKLPFYGGLPVFPGMQIGAFDEMMKAQSFVPPKRQENLLHSQSELDMLLYGYTKSKTPGYSHALSGLGVSNSKSDKSSKSSAAKSHSAVVEDDSLPEGVIVQQLTFAGIQHSSAFTTRTFAKGHMFGPFQGKNVYASEIKTNDGNSSMWEIFKDGKLKYFIDGRGSNGNWMSYVNCARYSQEQNLNALQVDGEIFYQANKEIPEGKELLVWYGDAYSMFMGIPVGLKVDFEDSGHKEDTMSAQALADDSNGYTCERCGKVFAYKYYKDKHLKYTRCVDQGNRKFPCTLCSRSFEKRDRLRIHILHVHEKHRPHKCTVCSKCFSQSSSLNKHMRVHSGERPYKCVYCNKAFTASSILRTHIRQHSGEKPFKCKFCGKAFASHAAHDSHVRRTHPKDKIELAAADILSCKMCHMTFEQPMELTVHLRSQHQGAPLLDCNTCGYLFSSQYELYTHSTHCLASPEHNVCDTSLDSAMTDEEYFTGQSAAKKDEIDVVG